MSALPGYPPLGTHDVAAPAAPTGEFPVGVANAAAVAVSEGDAAALSLTLNRNLRVLTPKVGVPLSFTDASVAGGDSTVTFRTVPAGRLAVLTSCLASYTGTMTGVSLQLWLDGVEIGDAFGSLASGVLVPVLTPGKMVWATAASTYQIRIVGATATDNLDVRAMFMEEVL